MSAVTCMPTSIVSSHHYAAVICDRIDRKFLSRETSLSASDVSASYDVSVSYVIVMTVDLKFFLWIKLFMFQFISPYASI